jgi:hypothetical protein
VAKAVHTSGAKFVIAKRALILVIRHV